MSSRKAVAKSAGQRRRRSPRISALDTRLNLDDTVAALPPLSKLPKQVWKGAESPQNDDFVDWRSLKQNQNHDRDGVMPAKHTLELVLDTLQRRDTYEIFAQPVDPNQVENYYEIVKEPMDFGTMRAKLHEGMYQNLQQFKHDVFLIPENAMHFNSSTTTYFRQARAIHDLANKVFHLLKTKPQNFVEGTRRRSMRKTLCDSIPKPPTSTFRPKTPGRLSNSHVADRRRETYLCKEEDAVGSTTSKPLLLGDISYEDSLMWYVKDLGPTALLVAKRKLMGQHESNACPKPKQFKTFRDFAPAGCNPFVNASNTTRDVEEAKLEQKRKDKKVPAVVRDLNCSSRPVILALENCHSEFKSRNKKSCNVSATPKPVCDEAAPQQLEKHLPLLSHFTFDLPFFKARLEQIKAVEMGLKRKKPGLSIYQ
ncbi:bromodomain testis-specific protein-like [Salvia divinorum]|uniref:Bromodomain testis-specific protein-like n=1 Tax=Salvia divinorum TaxID=28513 RepID=A0ABD1GYH1_SALDI